MPIEVYISDERDGDHARIVNVSNGEGLAAAPVDGQALMTETPFRLLGQFRAASRTTAGTSVITSPPLGGSLIITDLTVSSDRTNSGLVTVQLADDTRSIALYTGNATDAPVNVHIQYAGRVRGWKDARLELVTVNAVDAYVTAGYVKAFSSDPFPVWDNAR